MRLRRTLVHTRRSIFSSISRNSRRRTTRDSKQKKPENAKQTKPETRSGILGRKVEAVALGLFVGTVLEEYYEFGTTGRDSLVHAVKWLCDGEHGERLRRERYAFLQSKLHTDNDIGHDDGSVEVLQVEPNLIDSFGANVDADRAGYHDQFYQYTLP